MNTEAIAIRVAREHEARVLVAYADELRKELSLNSREAVDLKLWAPLAKSIKRGLVKSGNVIYKKLVEPHLDEVYDEEIEEDAEEWCKDNGVDPCNVPDEVLEDIVDDVKVELKTSLGQRYFVNVFQDAVRTVNPINIVKTAYKAIKKHGMRIGLKVAIIILIGDVILPVLGGMIHPALFAIISVTPHTEIAIAILAVTEAAEKAEILEWVTQYEKATGEDLVKGRVFS